MLAYKILVLTRIQLNSFVQSWLWIARGTVLPEKFIHTVVWVEGTLSSPEICVTFFPATNTPGTAANTTVLVSCSLQHHQKLQDYHPDPQKNYGVQARGKKNESCGDFGAPHQLFALLWSSMVTLGLSKDRSHCLQLYLCKTEVIKQMNISKYTAPAVEGSSPHPAGAPLQSKWNF